MSHVVISVTTTQRVRALVVWAAVTVGLLGVVGLTLPVIGAPDPASFTDLLVRGCAATALVSSAAVWWTTTDVTRAVVTGGIARAGRLARPGPVRAAVLLACGLSLLAGPALADADARHAPSHPSDRTATERTGPVLAVPLTGLPLPDRATGGRRSDAGGAGRVHTVAPGEHLWGIARAELGPQASNARVAAHVRELHRANAAVIGEDPDLILPDQRLRLPPVPGRNHR